MIIYNASGVTCQLGNLCFECTTLYTHFSASSILNIVTAGNGNGNGNRDVQKKGNGNKSMRIGTTIIIPAHSNQHPALTLSITKHESRYFFYHRMEGRRLGTEAPQKGFCSVVLCSCREERHQLGLLSLQCRGNVSQNGCEDHVQRCIFQWFLGQTHKLFTMGVDAGVSHNAIRHVTTRPLRLVKAF